ncbi:NAD(P)-binding protein [Polychaeton citri CBS 116435]|uniref:NAD(P)-binding protein n=1 Tax=Polychaeton citri CBS 116435 TaxID=1314669 RepID=A0A9P4UTG6_9PEZI|nr:NAD(P)-binding protein [Polychaeton citri CBS 116435]
MSSQQNEIAGRLCLITGASGGIGAACALALAAEGCDLALTYSSNKEAVDKLAVAINTATEESNDERFKNQKITVHHADMGNPEQILSMCDEVQKSHGRGVDILIPNAGYGKRITDPSDIPLEEFDAMININLRAPFLCVKGVVDHMKAQKWGRIIFMSSIAAIGGGANGCHYAASKGGLSGMMKNLSTRLAQYNISVNDVAPAMIGATGMLRSADEIPGLLDSIPLNRLGEPQEVANAVVMLAKTGWMTGQSLLMTGGLK